MALVADIQLQNNSVTPEKIDEGQFFTFGSVSATTGVFIGPSIPGSLSGLLTLKTANDTEAWFQTTKTDGDVSFYINNDSNTYWRVSLSGEAPANGGIGNSTPGVDDSLYIQKGADPLSPNISTIVTIQPEGNIGLGTQNPVVTSILDISSTDSTSANVTLRNLTDSTILKISSGISDVSIGSESDTPFSLKVNDNIIGTVKVTGFNLETGKSFLINNQNVLNETDLYVGSYAGIGTSSTNVSSFAAGHSVITAKGTTTGKSGHLELVSNDNITTDENELGTISFINNNTRIGLISSISEDINANSGHIAFSTTNAGAEAEVMRINNIGNIGVGLTDPLYRLHLQDEGSAISTQLSIDTYNGTSLTNASELLFRKSNSDTGGTKTATSDTEILGVISFHGVNSSSDFVNSANISVIQNGTAGATYVAGDIVFKTGTNVAAPVERMRIDSAGNVGIGVTANSSYALDVNGSINYTGTIYHNNAELIANNTANYIITGENNGTLNGEQDLTFDGTLLTVNGDLNVTGNIELTSVLPSLDSTYDLGSSLNRWRTLYVDTIGDNGQALGIAATTLSFDTAATIDTSGANQLDINTGTANLAITSGIVTMSGGLTVDTNTLIVDSVNNNVGIGNTPNSLYSLDVAGDINIGSGELKIAGNSFVANNTANYVITGESNGTLNAESALTFNGTLLNLTGNLDVSGTIESGTITPEVDSTSDLGTTLLRWANAYIDDITITNGISGLIANDTDTYLTTANGNGTLQAESNLTFNTGVLTVTGNVIPGANSTHDLGTNTVRWNNLYVDNITTTTNLTIGSGGITGLIANDTNNYITTSTGNGTLNAESALTFDGTTLQLTGAQTISGNLTVDTTTLVVNSTNNNVGIGAAPNALYALDVTGDINYTGDLYVGGSLAVFSNWTNVSTDIYRSSNVGIGSTSIAIQPWDTGSVLTVSDDASGIGIIEIDSKKADADATAMGALTFTSNAANTNHKVLGLIESATQGTTGGSRGGQLRFYTKADNIATPTQKMVITNDGKVGINDSDPSHTLDVTGDINFSGNLYQAGNLAIFSNWTINGANIYRESHVGIGSSAVNIQTWRSGGSVLTISDDTTRGNLELNSVLADADAANLGALLFTYSTNTTNHKTVGVVEVDSEGTTANQRGGRIKFLTKPDASTTPVTRMVITNDGKVGINTTVPGYTLHVDGDINFTGSLRQNGTVAQFSNWTINGANIYRSSNVGIGVTNPAERLEIGSPGTTSVTITNSLDTVGMKMTADTASAVISTTTDHPIDFKVNNTIIGSVDSSGVNLQSGKTYRIDGVDITLGGGGGGGSTTLTAFTINWPSEESTAINAHRLVFADLSDTEYCWNWEAAKRESRNKSWYTELGLPPTHSFLLVENNQNTLRWFNRNYETNGTYFQVYATFNTGVNDVIPGAINDVMFFDFKIYVGTASGLIIIDLLQDQAYKIDSTGQYIYNGNLSQRNDGLGWLLLNGSTSVINTAITNFDVTRDPNGNEDAYTRPFHYWAVATPGGLSLQKPYSSNYGGINDWNETVAVKSVSFLNKSLVWNIDDTEDRTSIYDPFADIAADGFVATSDIRTTAVNPYEKSSFTTGVTLTDVGTLFPADDIETILIGSNEGLSIRRSVSGETVVTDTYATPYMNEGRTGSYPLDGLNDRSGNGYTLTNQGSAVFTGLSPFGVSCVNLDGVDDVLKVTGQAGFGETVAISFYMKSASSTNPTGGNDEILSLTDGAATNGKLSVYTEATTGKIGVTFSDDNGSTSDALLSDGDIYDGNWHHVYLGKLLGDNTYWHLYVDGVMVARTTITNAAGTFGYDDLRIGTDSSETNFWAGEISQLYLSTVPYNESEIVLEYGRMRSGLGGAIATLTSSTIDTIETDSDSGYAIINAGNTVHLMDARTGLSYATDTVSVGSLNHADIRSMPEAVTPHYLIAGTNSIEQVAPDTNVLNGGVPLTEVQSNGISDLTAFSISWPEKVSVNYDAHKMYFVELNETKYCWDFEYVKRDSRNKSWYTGTPPTNGFMVVDAAQNVISWINRSYESNGQTYFQRYKNFVSKANNIVSANVVDIRFLDFKLYVATDSDGLCIIDFFQDKGYKINASGYYVYNGNVSEANDELGWTLLSSTLALVSSNTTSFDIVRDPDSKEDFYSRPIHYWAVGTDTGTSYHRPSISSYGDIFDSSSTTPVIDVEFINTSLAVSINDTEDQTLITNDFILIGADAWGSNVNLRPTPANPYEKTFFSTNAVISDTSSLYSPNNKETLLIGTDEGLSIRRSLSGEIGITSSYVTPLMDEGRVAVYPLNDVNDRSGNGYNLTNNGITFAAGPVGFAAVGDGSTWMEYNGVGSDFDVDLTWSFSLYTATNDTNIPASNAHVAQIDGVAFPPTISIIYKSTLNGADSGKLAVRFDDGITTIDLQSTSPIYDAKWHSVVVTSDGVNVYLYIDGILNDSASLGAITDVNFGEDLYLFTSDGTQNFYNGKIQQVMLSDTPMDYDEVSLHYARMQEGLGGATALLSDDNVKTIEVDGDSGYAIVTAGNTSHIMNTQTGLFYSTDLVDSGVLRHADILSMSKSFTPHYIMGSSTCIEQVAPSTTVLNGGVPLTGNNSGNSTLSAFEITWPEEYSTDYDAHKIYFNDVKNTKYCWNWDTAKRDFRNKSWYNELGNPPSHGFFVVDSSKNSMQWVNRSYGTDGVSFFGSFMLFVSGGNNIISGNIVEAKFIDFKLYIATSNDGVCVIDFLQDKGYKINASGYYIYNGNITDRNAGSGWLQLSSALKIVNSNTTSIDVIRDPQGKEDIFARPLHYWSVGTGFGISLYNPTSGNTGVIYDSANTNVVYDTNFVGGILTWSTDETNDTISIKNHFTNITSDTWAADTTINSTKTDWTKTFFSGTEVLSDLGALYGSNGEDILLVGSNEGLSLRKGITGNGKEIGLTDTYVTPTMKGDRVVSYPLNDLNDRSGYGRNLTSVGLTFTNNSPFGILSAGTGSGVYGEWNDVGVDFEGIAVSLFFKSDDASNAGLKETILSLKDSTSTDGMVELFTDTNGYLNALWSTDHTSFVPNTSDTIVSVGDIQDGQWHHIYFGQIEGDQLNWYLFVDGHQVGSVAITTGTFNNNYVGIGIDAAGGDEFTGDVANVFVGNTAWSTNDIEFEHNRMLSGLAGTNTAILSATDIDSIEVDVESGYAIITAGDSANIMDTKNGMILSVDPLGVGTLNHADIISLPESDNPHYLLGGANAIEQIAPSTSVLNGGIPTTSNSSALNNIINAFFLMGA